VSRIKIQSPIIHTPSFKEYSISGPELARKYEGLGIDIPFPRSDNWYYHTDVEGWAKVIDYIIFKSDLYKAKDYKPEKKDCDKFARKAFLVCLEIFELTTLFYTYGKSPVGVHGFNSFWTGDDIMLLEPNEGFEDERGNYEDVWGTLDGDIIFPIGGNEYIPQKVLM